MKLFEVGKVGMFLDKWSPGVETRRGDEVKIVTLVLRVQPFTATLAAALEQKVRGTLFNLNSGEPQPHLKRVEFALGIPRQQLHIFASPDTKKASILFDQAKVFYTLARTEKDLNGFAFVVKTSFGPVGKLDLEYLQDWLLNQRFVTFEQAEPGLFPDDADDYEPDEETHVRPAPMFDDDPTGAAPH